MHLALKMRHSALGSTSTCSAGRKAVEQLTKCHDGLLDTTLAADDGCRSAHNFKIFSRKMNNSRIPWIIALFRFQMFHIFSMETCVRHSKTPSVTRRKFGPSRVESLSGVLDDPARSLRAAATNGSSLTLKFERYSAS
jgi:hypothetical protein